ncbi:MAG: TolC family protein [Akkermansiaceae bacterium]
MKTLLPCSLALILVGCTAYSPSSRIGTAQKDAPGRWSATPEARTGIDTNWVRRIAGGRGESIVDEALSANPDMRIAAERVNRAIASARTAGAALKPNLEAGLSGNRNKQNFVGFPSPFGGAIPPSTFDSYGANFTTTWEPDIWGFNRAGVAAQIAQAEMEGQNYRAARASLAAQTLRAWLAMGEANEKIALAAESEQLLQTTIDIVRDRFESALVDEGGSASQLRLAESRLASAKAVSAQRKGEREQAVRQLELLMGRYPAGAFQGFHKLPEVPPMPPAGLPSELLLRRPDILAAERNFASTGSLLKQATLAFYPSIKLTASAGTSSGSLRDIVDSNFGIWSLGANLTQPIWRGGAIRSEKNRLKSEDRQALAQLQKTVLNAFGEVEQSLVADRFLAQREAAVANALSSSQKAATAAYDDYAGGTGDALMLINAQQNRIDLAAQLVTLRRLRLDNRITFHLALGGDYRVGK